MAIRAPSFGGGGAGGGGRRWGIFAGDNPMTWSVPLGVIAGITVRISLIYIVWMILRLVTRSDIGWTYELWSLGSLFLLVLLHEFGHCFACRAVGGEADQILMWMLGGLAYCRPPHNWKAALITTIGGPGVNVVIAPLLMGIMMAFGTPLSALFFNPWGGLGSAWISAVNAMGPHLPRWLIYGLFTLHVSNATLLLFNVLLPFYPFDGGRILQELLWRKYGYTRSMWIATAVGLVGAAALGVLALYNQNMQMFLIAAFGGFTCWQQRQQLRFIGDGAMTDERWSQWGADGEGWKYGGKAVKAGGATARDQKRQEKARKASEAQRAQAENDGVELDRILAKIKEKGMASLTRGEQAFLRRSSEKSRGNE